MCTYIAWRHFEIGLWKYVPLICDHVKTEK